jgi:hypothetical protein
MNKAISFALAAACLVLLAATVSYNPALARPAQAVRMQQVRPMMAIGSAQAPEPPGPESVVKGWAQRAQDQVNAWIAAAKEKIIAEQEKLKADMELRLKQEADNAAQSLGERITLELHKVVDQVCGGASAGLILGATGLALAIRARRAGG